MTSSEQIRNALYDFVDFAVSEEGETDTYRFYQDINGYYVLRQNDSMPTDFYALIRPSKNIQGISQALEIVEHPLWIDGCDLDGYTLKAETTQLHWWGVSDDIKTMFQNFEIEADEYFIGLHISQMDYS